MDFAGVAVMDEMVPFDFAAPMRVDEVRSDLASICPDDDLDVLGSA